MEQSEQVLFDNIKRFVPESSIYYNEPMKCHTTFKVGGEAKFLVKISSDEELTGLIPLLSRCGEPYYVKGNGSNLLVGDKGYNGVILEIGENFSDIMVEGDTIVANAGALMSKVAKVASSHNLSGLEFASGIPGTIGGGVVMNAGAYGGELKDVVTEVKVCDPNGEIMYLDNADMEFGYRMSVLKMRPFTVLQVKLKLMPGDEQTIRKTMDDLNEQRRLKQPLEYPSAGSTFKRPKGNFAGKLIMDAGLRGYTIGGAQVSEKHCGFVINKGNATAADIYEVIATVQETVKDKFDVNLEPEIIFIGTF